MRSFFSGISGGSGRSLRFPGGENVIDGGFDVLVHPALECFLHALQDIRMLGRDFMLCGGIGGKVE